MFPHIKYFSRSVGTRIYISTVTADRVFRVCLSQLNIAVDVFFLLFFRILDHVLYSPKWMGKIDKIKASKRLDCIHVACES